MEKETYIGDVPNTPLRFVAYISKPHKWWGIFAFLAMFIAIILEIVALYVVAQFVDQFTSAEVLSDQLQIFYFWGAVFFVAVMAERYLWRLSGFLGIKYLVEMNTTGHKTLYEYLMKHSHGYFIDRFAGAVSNKVYNASDGVATLMERLLWGMIPQAISVIMIVFVFGAIHWLLGVVLLLLAVAAVVLNTYLGKKRRPYVVDYTEFSSKVRGDAVDLMTNISTVRQYASSSSELARMNLALETKAKKNLKEWFMGDWFMVLNTTIGLAITAFFLWSMYFLLEQGLATIGTAVLMFGLLGRLGFTFTHIGNMVNNFVRFYGESEEGLNEILVNHEIKDKPTASDLLVQNGGITWQAVTFAYQEKDIFKRLSLNIKPGERVGLVGPSGAGKTTFVSLLLRQHDIQYGAITIDGQNIAEVTQDSLRKNIALVPQEPMLFHRTIRENILYGKADATEEEMITAAKRAQAHEFIVTLPDQYDTLVGERGVKLSGGQKQRVAIARAMLKEAPVLVLDEATSALDSESEVAIQQALEELMEGKTVIAVAHRLSTLRKMDRILVFENGKIIEDGSHDELAAGDGLYAKLWEHQAGGFLQE